MIHPVRIFQLCLLAASLAAQFPNQNISGRWTGVAETLDEAGTKRQEKQTIEIRSNDGMLTGNRVGKDGKPGLKLELVREGTKLNVYCYLDFEGGEPLRWKLELREGMLVGTFSAQHHNPRKWIYDRVGAITLAREK